jgi:hypothetical protein
LPRLSSMCSIQCSVRRSNWERMDTTTPRAK